MAKEKKKGCDICGGKLGLLGGYPVKDGILCPVCYARSRDIFVNGEWKEMKPDELARAFENPPQIEKKKRTDAADNGDTPVSFPDHGHKQCGICGAKVNFLTYTLVLNGVVCPKCDKRLREWYPVEYELKKQSFTSRQTTEEYKADQTNYRRADPLRGMPIEWLVTRLSDDAQEKKTKAEELSQKGDCDIILQEVGANSGLFVAKQLVNVLHMPYPEAIQLSLHTPAVLRQNVPYEEAVRIRDEIMKEDAKVEVR